MVLLKASLYQHDDVDVNGVHYPCCDFSHHYRSLYSNVYVCDGGDGGGDGAGGCACCGGAGHDLILHSMIFLSDDDGSCYFFYGDNLLMNVGGQDEYHALNRNEAVHYDDALPYSPQGLLLLVRSIMLFKEYLSCESFFYSSRSSLSQLLSQAFFSYRPSPKSSRQLQ